MFNKKQNLGCFFSLIKTNNFSLSLERRVIFNKQDIESSFQALPENITKDNLKNLRNKVGRFDEAVDTVAQLQEKQMLQSVKDKFNTYSEKIKQLEKPENNLNDQQKLLLSEVKIILKELSEDLSSFASDKKVEFKSEYLQTKEYFEKEGFEKADLIWFAEKLSNYQKTVPLGKDETFNAREKNIIITLFSKFEIKETEILIEDIQNLNLRFSCEGFDISKLTTFLINLSDENVKKIYFSSRKRDNLPLLLELVLKKPQNLVTCYNQFKEKTGMFIGKINSSYASNLLLADDINLLLEVSQSFAESSLGKIFNSLKKNIQCTNDPIFQEYLASIKQYAVDKPDEHLRQETSFLKIETAIDNFIDQYKKNLIQGIVFEKNKSQKHVIDLNGISIFLNENLNINYGRSKISASLFEDAFLDDLKNNNIKSLQDFNLQNFSIINPIYKKCAQRKKTQNYIRSIANELDDSDEIRTISYNNYLEIHKGYKKNKISFIVYVDPENHKITRLSPELKAAFTKNKIFSIADEESRSNLVYYIKSIIERKSSERFLQVTRAEEEQEKQEEKINQIVKELNNIFDLCKFSFYFSNEDNQIKETPRFYVKNKIFDMTLNIDADTLAIDFEKNISLYSTKEYKENGGTIYNSRKLGQNFIQEFKDKLTTINDLKTYQQEIDKWISDNMSLWKAEKEAWEKDYLAEKEAMEKEAALLKKLLKEAKINKKDVKVIFGKSDYSDEYFCIEISIEGEYHDIRSEYNNGKIIYRYKYDKDYFNSRDKLIAHLKEKVKLKKRVEIIENFFTKDYYQLRNIFTDNVLKKEIIPVLKKGFDVLLELIIDFCQQESDLKTNQKILNFLLQSEYFEQLSDDQKKTILDKLKNNIDQYNQINSNEEKIMLLSLFESSFNQLNKIVVGRNISKECKDIVVEYLLQNLNCCGADIDKIILESYIKLIGHRSIADNLAKKLFVKLNQELKRDSFTQKETEQIYSLLSDVNILSLAPLELQSEIIIKTMQTIKNSTDHKIIKQAVQKLNRIARDKDFKDFSDSVIDLFFSLLQDKNKFAFSKDQKISFEALANLDMQVAYDLVNIILLEERDGDVQRLLKLIKSNKKIGELVIDILIGQESKIKNNQLVEFVNKEIEAKLPKSPNYEKILEDGKIVFEIEFLDESFLKQWQLQILGKPTVGEKNKRGFMVTEEIDQGREVYFYKTNINNIPVELRIVKPGKKRNVSAGLFDALQREDIDGKWYFGHATAGYELDPAVLKMFEDSKYQDNSDNEKILGLSACSSGPYYRSKVKSVYKKIHIFVNQRSTRGNDDAYTLWHLIKGIAYQKNYKEIRENVYDFYDNPKTKYTKPENNKDDKHHDRDNMIYPDQKIGLIYQDSDRDGIDDYRDNEYTINYEELPIFDRIEFNISGATKLPRRNLSSVRSFIYGRFMGSLEPFRNINFPVKEKGVGWFNRYEGYQATIMGREDIGDEVIKISDTKIDYNYNDNSENYYWNLEVSAAYKHCSDRVLKALVCYELSDYFLKNYRFGETNRPIKRNEPIKKIEGSDKYLPFLKGINAMMYEYHGASLERRREIRPALETIYLQFRDKYDLPSQIDFETAYQWSWSKRWFGNIKDWQDDPLLQNFANKYNSYMSNETLYQKDLGKLKKSNRARYDKIISKTKKQIAQYLSCEDIMKKVENLSW